MLIVNCDIGSKTDTTSQTEELVYESITIDSSGGTHIFESGITIAVPKGAVAEETTIEIAAVPFDRTADILSALGRKSEDIVAAFDAKPDGLTFAEPIELTIPVPISE